MKVRIIVQLLDENDIKLHTVRGLITNFTGSVKMITDKFAQMFADLIVFKNIMDGDVTPVKDVER
jgi:hypothetical protein